MACACLTGSSPTISSIKRFLPAMQVDFYQLTRDPAVAVVPLLAQRTLDAGARMLVVSGGEPPLDALSQALWSWRPESFLAHGLAGEGAEADQPILLSEAVEAGNKAAYCLIADGIWREEAGALPGVERIFYLFAPERTDDARAAWRMLSKQQDWTLNYWRQDGGKWRKGP